VESNGSHTTHEGLWSHNGGCVGALCRVWTGGVAAGWPLAAGGAAVRLLAWERPGTRKAL